MSADAAVQTAKGEVVPDGAVRVALDSNNAGAGFEALCAIARLHHVAADPATLAHQLGLSGTDD